MSIVYYLPVFMLFLLYFVGEQKKKKKLRKIIKNRNSEEQTEMVELAKLFLEKECVIDTIEHQVIGVIEEVSEGAILLKTESGMQMLNLDFVERIREFPRNKKGKKKSVILD